VNSRTAHWDANTAKAAPQLTLPTLWNVSRQGRGEPQLCALTEPHGTMSKKSIRNGHANNPTAYRTYIRSGT
jgi:hypothetical protein